MLDNSEITRVLIQITYLLMEQRPQGSYEPLSGDFQITLEKPSAEEYKDFHKWVGENHLWWLIRSLPSQQVQLSIDDPNLFIYVLHKEEEFVGFIEIEIRHKTVNIGYFGLIPSYISKGIGFPFLRLALDLAWDKAERDPRKLVTLNTSSADHPRALPFYLKAGFRPFREEVQIWPIPNYLELEIPPNCIIYK